MNAMHGLLFCGIAGIVASVAMMVYQIRTRVVGWMAFYRSILVFSMLSVSWSAFWLMHGPYKGDDLNIGAFMVGLMMVASTSINTHRTIYRD